MVYCWAFDDLCRFFNRLVQKYIPEHLWTATSMDYLNMMAFNEKGFTESSATIIGFRNTGALEYYIL